MSPKLCLKQKPGANTAVMQSHEYTHKNTPDYQLHACWSNAFHAALRSSGKEKDSSLNSSHLSAFALSFMVIYSYVKFKV